MGPKVISYFSSRASNYLVNSNSGFWKFVRNQEKQVLCKWIHAEKGQSLLDAGAGAGYYALYFRDEKHLEVSAVDSTPAMVNELLKNKISAQLSSLEELTTALPMAPFDRILAAGVFEFVPEPQIALKNLSLQLRDSGRLVLLIPADGFFGKIYSFFHFNIEIYIRGAEFYKNLAEKSDLKFLGSEKASPMSLVLAFEKT